MKQKYNVVFIISSLLMILLILMASINYNISLRESSKQIKENSLPLSLENIYDEIEDNIVKRQLIASMMSNNIFVHDWIKSNSNNHNEIIEYLLSVKNKYNIFDVYLVSEISGNDYTQNALMGNMNDKIHPYTWYKRLKNSNKKYEFNLDFSKIHKDSFMLYINHKIIDKNNKFLGITGLVIKMTNINKMLELFRKKYNATVIFFDEKGDIILSESKSKNKKNIDDLKYLKNHKNEIISKNNNTFEYKDANHTNALTVKYLENLDLYMSVSVQLDAHLKYMKNVYIINILFSLLISTFIAYILLIIIRRNNAKLLFLANHDELTGLFNRRSLETRLKELLLLQKRKEMSLCIAFFDIDNFKKINDTFGHYKGDLVLKELSKIFQENLRNTDFICRWGGEEFVMIFAGNELELNKNKLLKIKDKIEYDNTLLSIVEQKTTVSIGLTSYVKGDTLETFISRSDKAMYLSKTTGKNKLSTL